MTTLAKSLFGDFYGAEFSFAYLEKMAFREVETWPVGTKKADRTKANATRRPLCDGKMLAPESGLFRSKWFDYRRLHPCQATLLFAHFYNLGYKRAYHRHIDYKRAPGVRGFPGDNVFRLPLTSFVGFWKARQTADAMGLPYDFFINRGIDLALNSGWNEIPRPAQLYDPEKLARVSLAWDEWTGAKIQHGSDPWYRLDAFVEHRDQVAHQEWLVSQIKRRPRPEFLLAELCFRNPMLDTARAEAVFGASKMETAREFAACN